LTIFDDWRAAAPIGTIWSSSREYQGRDVDLLESSVRSVSEKALMQS